MDERVVERFWSRVDKIELTGCWLWDGYINKNRYGTWSYSDGGKTKTVYAHRTAYELLVGPVPEGLVLDHLCRVRFCCNPDHLNPTTQRQNLRRSKSGEAGAATQRDKTHCPQGHPYSGDNVYRRKDGGRACRACGRIKAAEYQAKKRAENPPTPRPRKEMCLNGHAFTPENTFTDRRGSRSCRECSRERTRQIRAKRKADQPARPPRTHCKAGHELTPENTYLRKSSGQRVCRACHAARTLANYHRKKATASAS